MKGSRFNLVTHYEPTDEVLVFNTATGALAAFPSAVADDVRTALGSNPVALTDEGLWKGLSSQGFLVEDDADEVETVLRRLQLGIDDPNRLDVFVLPNMKCNFACPYCFEEHRASQMSDEVTERLLAWFQQSVFEFKALLLSWFGGEPMLSFRRMVQIQRAVAAMCESNGVKFNAHITTNGYLLTPDRAAELVDAGVRSYQITIDGPPDIHNGSRVLKGGGDSFTPIFENLCSLAREHSDTHIKLRVNYDGETLERVPELLDMVPREIRPRLTLVLERIFGHVNLYEKRTVRELAKATEDVYTRARELGFETTTAGLARKLTYCYADRASEFVFNHQGDVFKCTVGNFTRDERLGTLTPDGRVAWDGEGYDDWMSIPAVDDKCRGCTYLPMCMGGCRKSRKYTGRSSDDCTLPFDALDERIRRRYEQTLAPSEPAVI
jgi:uncharacterized protein